MSDGPRDGRLSIGECVTHALSWEAMAAKPGNVHRGADFEDMTFADMTTAAVAIGAAISEAVQRPTDASLGEVVLQAVAAMRATVEKNTHLGTILLIGPLAMAARRDGELLAEVASILASTTDDDTRHVYEAIRLASPGGMGKVEEGDVTEAPTTTLLEAMGLAADRDTIARQYIKGFADVQRVAGRIAKHRQRLSLHDAIVAAHVEQMAQEPDSLIARKCGGDLAREVQARAAAVAGTGAPGSEIWLAALADLDFWLRADGHRRNPGTTADLIGAALFVLLVEGSLSWGAGFYSSPVAPCP